MEDLHAAGGMGAVLSELEPLLHLDVPCVTGEWLGDRLTRIAARYVNRDVVRDRHNPISPLGGLIGLSGSLAPDGALLKRAAATPALMEHTGRAVVFSSLEDLAARIDDPDLDVTADDVLVLQNAGPRSAAAMPEAGYLPIPKKLAAAGVKDMVRISDARMSGTAFGTIVLHVTPEAALGGPLALVRNGDRIALSASRQSIDLLVDEAELDRRRAALPPAPPPSGRGYDLLYSRSVLPATEGCDFDFLRGV
jgi:dihydroxy-acid dehydratase